MWELGPKEVRLLAKVTLLESEEAQRGTSICLCKAPCATHSMGRQLGGEEVKGRENWRRTLQFDSQGL